MNRKMFYINCNVLNQLEHANRRMFSNPTVNLLCPSNAETKSLAISQSCISLVVLRPAVTPSALALKSHFLYRPVRLKSMYLNGDAREAVSEGFAVLVLGVLEQPAVGS